MAVHSRPGGGITLLVLNPVNIQRMYEPGGITYRWMRNIVREVEVDAIATCPVRTGEMKSQHGISITPLPNGLQANVRNTSAHAIFVHEGTRDQYGTRMFIGWGPWAGGNRTASRGLRRYPKGTGFWFLDKWRVRGQRANPWLRNAMQRVLAAHRIPTL
jgi:hypothetical protein